MIEDEYGNEDELKEGLNPFPAFFYETIKFEKIVNRRHQNRLRVQVDIEGYLENKKNNLIQMAERLAKKAKRTGKPASIGQMNAHDRRIVHLALKNDSDVRTQSMGEGFYRKLVIFPKKTASRNQKPQ